MKKLLLLLLSLSILASCQKDIEENENPLDIELEQVLNEVSNGQGLSNFILPNSNDFTAIPQDPNNPLNTKKVNLGKLLYHETGLALSPKQEESKGTFSCASCHFASAGFQSCRIQGIAEGGEGFGLNGEGRVKIASYDPMDMDVQPLRTPTAMNGAYQKNMLWNGQFGATGLNTGTEDLWPEETPIAINHLGFEGLETQAIAGLKVHRLEETKEFLENYYKTRFDQVFPDDPEENRYSSKNTGLAIAAYERTVLSNQAPFQKWLKGEKYAMTYEEKKGAILFFDKANCASCHNGPALNSMTFQAIGMNDLHMAEEATFLTPETDNANLGRGGFTKKVADNYKFKVPQLYNLRETPFYGHGSSFRSIREVIEYKNNAVAENSNVPSSQLAEHFVPLNLTENEIDQLTAFISSALNDPNLMRYQPTALPSGNCTPFNDPIAKLDLGCD